MRLRASRAQTVFLTALILYAILAALAHSYAYFGWDVPIERRIQSISLPGFKGLMIIVSALGSGWLPVALVLGAGTALLLWRLQIEAAICVLGAALGSGVNSLVKALIERPRPSEPLVRVITVYRYNSFPSGHTVFFVEFFGFLFFLAFVLMRPGWPRRAVLLILGLLISLVGVSRVYLGAHWPSDVVGAYLAGGLWLMLMMEMFRRSKITAKVL